MSPDHRGEVPGYHGLYNFRHHFWVTAGSRLYPPVPDIALNISQDLAADIGQFIHQSLTYQFLPSLLAGTDAITSRVLTAIQWFNRATELGGGEQTSILHLAVAFEALMGLPEDHKTESTYRRNSLAAREGSTARLLGTSVLQGSLRDRP